MFPCFAMADDIKTFNFPDNGIPMYGGTLKDDLGPLHYVKFYSKTLGKTEKMGRIDENDNGTHMRNLRCGAFCGDKYYGYLVNIYSYVEQPKAFGTVDFTTGTFTKIKEYTDESELVSWPTMYEMTYDYAHKTLWALGRNQDGEAISDLYKIDLTNGDYEMVANLDFYAWAMACDYEGRMFMIKGIPDKKNEFYEACSIVEFDTEDNFKVVNEKRIKVEDKDFIPNFTHSMEFDHNSGELYWLGCDNSGYQKIYCLNTATGKAVRTGDLMYNTVAGLYIPFKGADCREAAGKVTEIKAEPAEDGSLKVDLEWTNPTKNWKGGELEALKSVSVSRGTEDNIIATLDANNGMGSKMTYEDAAAEKGYNIYYITTHRLEGENGLVDSVRVYVGADTPGRPQNIRLTAEGNNVRIDWEAPEIGAHGEKYDVNTTVYEITRMPDNKVIASNVKETTYTDDKIGSRANYSYIIKASNAEGEGLSETSSKILMGSAYEIPFADDFSKESCKDLWTILDEGYDGNSFEWGGGNYEEFCRFQAFLNNQHDMNDYLVTPPLATKAGKTYKVTYTVMLGSMEDVHKYELVTGNKAEASALFNVIDFHDNIKPASYNELIEHEATFKAEGDVSYVAVHCMSYPSFTGSYFAVKNFKIEEVYDNDLAVTAVSGPQELVAGEKTTMNVSISNVGLNEQKNFNVEIVSKDAEGNAVSMGSAKYTESLAAGATAEVAVEITAAEEGEIEIAGKVTCEGDMNEANNMSEWNSYKVNASGTADWNITCEGENTGVSTTEPMNFFNMYSTVETIYLKDEINAEKDGEITRLAFQYSDNSLSGETQECDVQIRLANTDKTEFSQSVSASDWTPLEESTLVCEKSIKIVPGTDNLLVFELSTPFKYDHTKNLSVQVWKDGSLEEMFPALFKVYSFGDDVFRSLRYNTNKVPYDFDESRKFFPVNNVPVLHLAMDFEDHSGIFEVNGGNGISFNNGVLAIQNGTLAKVNVFDAAGNTIYSENVNASSVRLNLCSGFYIIKAMDAEGKAHVIKTVVR